MAPEAQPSVVQRATEAVKSGVEQASHMIGEAASKSPIPPQVQNQQPGVEGEMTPAPTYIRDNYRGSGKLEGRVALITGGDSGIGRSVAVHFAREGADVAIMYVSDQEDKDAAATAELVQKEGRKCILIKGDVRHKAECESAVKRTVSELGGLDLLINNASIQHYRESLDKLEEEGLVETFRTNIFGMFFMAQAALPHLEKSKKHPAIINTTSVTAYQGMANLLDYSSTKGAIVSFTRSLSQQLVSKGIRVNAVAPGPIWTPLIPATFPAEKVAQFNSMAPMKRAGQPCECGTAYVFLASEDASFFSGQVLHPNGGSVLNV